MIQIDDKPGKKKKIIIIGQQRGPPFGLITQIDDFFKNIKL